MKHRSPQILYFSLVPTHISSFWEWVDKEECQYCKGALFEKAKNAESFSHAADLPLYLNEYDRNLQSLHVIIDFESIKGKDNVDIVRNTIVEFPEVQFLFDKHYSGKLTALSFLFPDYELEKYKQDMINLEWIVIEKKINASLFDIYINDPDDKNDSSILFSRIINGYDNTFDASNLRYAIKFWKCIQLKVHHSRNFKKIQDSRSKNLAICIEEETKQNIFNSYSLYTNGYRVLPITTRQELEIVNSASFKLPSSCPYGCKCTNDIFEEHGIVIRDFDLQFEDENQESVDAIRGFRYCVEDDFKHRSFFSEQVEDDIENYKVGWNILTPICNKFKNEPNIFWNALMLSGFPLYFVTKGPKYSKIDYPERNSKVFIKTGELHLPGFTKPVCGLYSPFQGLPEVKTTYKNTRYSVTDSDYEINISRKDHDHSTPLDIYDMANRMIHRAEKYYNNNRFLLAALVAGEAIEFLNGFHHRLMIKAYYIQAIAENAISMDAVGSNERYLAKDAQFRVDKIIEDIRRFYYGYEEKSKWNILNHIFSTCRKFCKEHEHFESEAVFISALGHLNEGYEISDIINEIKDNIRKSKNEIISFWRLIKNWKEGKKHKSDGE